VKGLKTSNQKKKKKTKLATDLFSTQQLGLVSGEIYRNAGRFLHPVAKEHKKQTSLSLLLQVICTN
jgi:hypothetical protein